MLKPALPLAVARRPVRDRPRHFRATRVDLEQLELRCRERAQRLMDLLLPVEQDTRVVDARAHAAHRLSRSARIDAARAGTPPIPHLLQPGNAHARDRIVERSALEARELVTPEHDASEVVPAHSLIQLLVRPLVASIPTPLRNHHCIELHGKLPDPDRYLAL